ncbi:MAG TPA: nitroreductase family deazaflavin-dependent oxidoreductase [Candidatus Limnocylindria bacterium]|nr:nitroreductase family deazaflavin-dependent oxidoreductase [Candidatus Limnocylindria bacterium]
MIHAARPVDRPPLFVRLFDPVARRLLKAGAPMGPNTLLTVRGRKSGQPRTAAVALVEIGERRWVISAFGDTHWVRNLRDAGEGLLRVAGREEPVRAVELTHAEAEAFFRDVLAPYVAGMGFPMRMVGRIFTRDVSADPEATAARRPVFELSRP